MITIKNNRTEPGTIFDYAKLCNNEKLNLINTCALFIEHFFDKQTHISIYFLNGFFIEVTTENNTLIDIIPYKRGYTLNRANANNEFALYQQAA